MSLKDNLLNLKLTVPENVKLVVVSKTQPPESIRELYDAGHRDFGENKAQELISKFPVLPDDIKWHFIGHLQTNKIKQIIKCVSLIHSVDSLRLLSAINSEANKAGLIMDCLLEFYIATEESKFGLEINEAREILSSDEYKSMQNIRIRGVMGMASFSDDSELIRREFRKLREIKELLKNEFFSDNEHFSEISMGMSGDYNIAIEEGSTIIRVGTAVFGERKYNL